jgi:tetratricopeptide (TPR) repeat protein
MTDHSDYIMAYISGDLSAEEKKQFEARLAADEELHRQFQIWAKGVEYIKARSMLEEIENDPNLPKADAQVKEWLAGDEARKANSRSRLARRFIFGSFSASVLIVAFLLIRSFTGNDPSRLFNKYYEPLSEEEVQQQVVRGSSEASLHEGISFYLKEEYSQACEILEPHQEGSFFLGLCLLEMERYEEALAALVRYEKTHPEHPGVQWYLGLTQLRLGNLEEASEYFTHIAGTSSSHKAEAERLKISVEKLQNTTDPQSSGRSGKHRRK